MMVMVNRTQDKELAEIKWVSDFSFPLISLSSICKFWLSDIAMLFANSKYWGYFRMWFVLYLTKYNG